MSELEKIKAMREGGKRLAKVRQQVVGAIRPGLSLYSLEEIADDEIKKQGGRAGFKMVPGYSWATCINVNEGVVHGIPHRNIKLNNGDMVSVDMGMFYKGYHTDTSTTVVAGKATLEQKKFLESGRVALKRAIKQARAGKRVGHISRAMQVSIENGGYNCVRNLTGHGLGKELHEPPAIPCILKDNIEQTPKLVMGMTLAIEAIYVKGGFETKTLDDNWTIVTKDGEWAGLFEETVLVTEQSPEILTK